MHAYPLKTPSVLKGKQNLVPFSTTSGKSEAATKWVSPSCPIVNLTSKKKKEKKKERGERERKEGGKKAGSKGKSTRKEGKEEKRKKQRSSMQTNTRLQNACLIRPPGGPDLQKGHMGDTCLPSTTKLWGRLNKAGG